MKPDVSVSTVTAILKSNFFFFLELKEIIKTSNSLINIFGKCKIVVNSLFIY